MKVLTRPAALLLVAATLTACGGGPGGATEPPGTQLVFTAVPDSVFRGTTFNPLLTVEVHDASGNLVTGSNANIVLHIRATTAGPLGGSLSHRAVGGVVVFEDVTLDSLGSYRIIAKSGSLDSAVTPPIKVVPPPPPPSSLEITVGGAGGAIQYRSTRNGSINPATDTLAQNGTVTWTWQSGNHGVQSTGDPAFTSSDTTSVPGNEYTFTFNNTGTFGYNCSVHGSAMTGKILVK